MELVLTQLWEGPCSKRGTEPNGSCPSPEAEQGMCLAESPAPKNARVCVWRQAASSHLHDGLRVAEDAMLSMAVHPCGTQPMGRALVALNSNMPSLFCRLNLTVLLHFLHVPGGNVCLLHVCDAAHAEPLHAHIPGPRVSARYVPQPAWPQAPLLALAQQSATQMACQGPRVKPCWSRTLLRSTSPP